MAVVRMVVLSDTHGQHRNVSVPDGDLLIHCGDWTKSSSKPRVEAYQDFASWLADLPHPSKVVVAGNKEIYMDTESCVKHRGKSSEEIAAVQQLLNCEGLTYLCDSGFLYQKSGMSLRLWGSPWTILNGKAGKAFQVEVDQMKEKWEKIPSDTDILVTHSPALGRLDKTKKGEAAGCPHLRQAIQRIRPIVHLCGHIHESHGILEEEGGTTTVNAAALDHDGKLTWQPVVLDIAADGSVKPVSEQN